jgi:hypothetical protein
MRKHNIILSFALALVLIPSLLMSQTDEKPSLSLNLKYFNDNNKTQHLLVQAKSKIDGKFQQIAGIPVQFYIGTDPIAENLLGNGVTNEKGEAVVMISSQAQTEWLKSPNQNFIVISSSNKTFDEARGDLAITKAKLKIDTADGKNITASIIALVDTVWTPVAKVDLIVGIKRLGGLLNVSEQQTYTTDSTGAILAEFKREQLPGDQKGNIILVACVVDNDTYGNLTAEMEVPWGTKTVYTTNFNHRSLFARRGYSPVWLELLSYTIVLAVWSVIFYLLFQIKKIKKLGIE